MTPQEKKQWKIAQRAMYISFGSYLFSFTILPLPIPHFLFLPFFVSSLWFLGVQIYFFTAKDGREEA